MSIEISHIVVNGCSFTYCQGIENPRKNGWPALLGKRLGVPVVNLAVGGSGNDAILRRTYEYFYKNKHLYPNSRPLYVIAFSGALRREEFFKFYKSQPRDSFITLDLQASAIDLVATLSNNGENVHKLVEYSHVLNMNYEACERKKFLLWNSTINLFKAYDVPYLTGDYFATSEPGIQDYMLKNFKEIYENAYEDKNCAGILHHKTSDLPKLPCGHETQEAMFIISDLFFDKLIENYGDVRHVPSEFLTLKSYYDFSGNFLLPNEWVEH